MPEGAVADAVVPHSLVVVPLVARGRIFGAISLGMTDTERVFGPEDQLLAEALGGRAALALDNARLHEEVQAASASRSRFYALLGHELRAPLGAILLYNDLLLSGAEGPLTGGQAEGIELSQRSARHLSELVDDLLDLSKLEAGKVVVRPEHCDVATLLHDLLATLRPVAAQRGSALEVECPRELPPIVTDPRRVRQILLNLLSNAVKFGDGKPIRIACEAEPEGGIAVAVADRGSGIAPEDQPRVWEEFVQLERPGRGRGERSGTGLGLAVSRRFAELLGGRIELRSQVGAGSTFVVHLPARIPAPSGEG
jgi:signal transduction histidine kinase